MHRFIAILIMIRHPSSITKHQPFIIIIHHSSQITIKIYKKLLTFIINTNYQYHLSIVKIGLCPKNANVAVAKMGGTCCQVLHSPADMQYQGTARNREEMVKKTRQKKYGQLYQHLPRMMFQNVFFSMHKSSPPVPQSPSTLSNLSKQVPVLSRLLDFHL